jgi:hypothetical protein
VLRRLDCVLEPTKPAVLAAVAKHRGKVSNLEPLLRSAAKEQFYNVSPLDHLRRLAGTLPAADRAGFDDRDLDLLNPWPIDGRYPADLIDADVEVVHDVIAAAERVVAAVVLSQA